MTGNWGDTVVHDVAALVGVVVESALPGGQFGAYRATHRSGLAVVLKAWPLPQFGPAWARGASIATRLHESGYPAPRYLGAGATETACWSVQELIPGTVPERLSESLARQMVAAVRAHRDQADGRSDFNERVRDTLVTAIKTLRTNQVTTRLAEQFDQVVTTTSGARVRTSDVVHSDFHAQNVLAQGDRLTGIFDWEGARNGDWRYDLANLVVTTDAEAASTELAAVPADVAALFVSAHCARYLAFDITNHPPDRVQQMAPVVETQLAHWWR